VSETTHVDTRLSGRETSAIGVVVSEGDDDVLARVVLRANKHDHAVLVTYDGPTPPAAVELVDGALATVVPPEMGETPEVTLNRAATILGYPGVRVHEDIDEFVDYESGTEQPSENSREGAATVLDAPEHADCEVLVGVPAYNEETTVATVVSEASEHADEVVVVDDGSDDDTANAARRAGATVIEHERNRGYGATLRTIFETAQGRGASHLVILDGDGQHEASDIPRLLEAQRECGAEIVIGSRFAGAPNEHIPLYRRIGLVIVNTLTNLSLGVVRSRAWVNDTQCGFRAYDRRAIESLAENGGLGDQMSASTDILYHANEEDFDIEEVGTTVHYDVENSSTHNPLSHGIVLVYNILMTVERKRPIILVGLPGFLSAFVGLGFGYWTFAEYITTGHFPITLAGISAFCTLMGLLACFTAIILHSLKTHLG
jgi:glycosyltransferase involved in cell wall biosynthesis